MPLRLHDRDLVIDTLHVIIVKPLNDDCMVLALNSTDVVTEGRNSRIVQ